MIEVKTIRKIKNNNYHTIKKSNQYDNPYFLHYLAYLFSQKQNDKEPLKNNQTVIQL